MSNGGSSYLVRRQANTQAFRPNKISEAFLRDFFSPKCRHGRSMEALASRHSTTISSSSARRALLEALDQSYYEHSTINTRG
ncbi:hypothetical protein RRG08_053055 [Elysia crispata]|uniref:Uncharacterized protein n=1 Tax=Elysia crispata TaxID=231223 RepID=A0AAE0XSM4_9GAST|nr:hypothetical protein RRG08_053055 [Elysia crispata]